MSDQERKEAERNEALAFAMKELLPLMRCVIIDGVSRGKPGAELTASAEDAAEAFYKGVIKFSDLVP